MEAQSVPTSDEASSLFDRTAEREARAYRRACALESRSHILLDVIDNMRRDFCDYRRGADALTGLMFDASSRVVVAFTGEQRRYDRATEIARSSHAVSRAAKTLVGGEKMQL